MISRNPFERTIIQSPETVTPTPSLYQGYIDAVSERHVAGWVRNLNDPADRVFIEVGLETTGEILTRGKGDSYVPNLSKIGVGDGEYGFNVGLPRSLTQEEQKALIVRPSGGMPLERSNMLDTHYNPIRYITMDVVDNCNLRCPFCVYDYAETHATHFMSDATFDASLRFAPYVSEGNFWFSCLHEPTLHPQLVEFINKVPRAYRSKVFYTTNLAKRMPLSYFEALADSGMHHINISVESLDPAIYEKMRKGARFHIFKENWDQLVEVFGRGSTPPKIQYISLAYKSTFRQLPALIDYLLQERRGSIVEVRHTYDVPHIPQAFREAEYMSREDWLWLRDRLAHYTAEQVMLVLPPGVVGPAADSPVSGWSKHVGRYVRSFRRRSLFRAVPAEPPPSVPPKPSHGKLPRGFLARQYGFRLSWDGRLDVNAVWGDQDDLAPPVLCLLTTNVRDIGDIEVFLNTLPA